MNCEVLDLIMIVHLAVVIGSILIRIIQWDLEITSNKTIAWCNGGIYEMIPFPISGFELTVPSSLGKIH